MRGGPTVVLQGAATDATVQFAALVAAAYSDGDATEVTVMCRSRGTEQEIRVARRDRSGLQAHTV